MANTWGAHLGPGPQFLLMFSPVVAFLVAHFLRARLLEDPEHGGILPHDRLGGWVMFVLVLAGPELTERVFGHTRLYLPLVGALLGVSFLARARTLRDLPQTVFGVGVLALAGLLAILQPEMAVAGTALAAGAGLSLLGMGAMRLTLCREAPAPPAASE